MPTEDQIVLEYQRLIHDVQQLSETLSDDRTVSTLQDDLVHVLPFVAGWTRHIGYLFGAVHLLVTSGLEHTVGPLVRQMLEDAVSAALVGQDPKTWESVLVTAWESDTRTRRLMESLGVAPEPEMEEYLATMPTDEGDGYREFRKMSERFRALGEDGERLLLTWQILTKMSHGDAFSATLSSDAEPGGLPSIRADPQYGQDLGLICATCLDSMLLALATLSDMIEGDPAGAGVDQIHARKAQLEGWMGIE